MDSCQLIGWAEGSIEGIKKVEKQPLKKGNHAIFVAEVGGISFS